MTAKREAEKEARAPRRGKAVIIEHLRAGELEQAVKSMDGLQVSLAESDFTPIIDYFENQIQQAASENELRSAMQFKRRRAAVKILRDHGFDLKKLIPQVVLPQGYNGKIMLLSIAGGLIEPLVCLRSGDLWHREIVINTEGELKDLGLVSTRVHELGGAHLRFEDDGSILIWGRSEYYGACDKEFAAELVRQAYPGRRVRVKDAFD
ncbi:MAG: hypothetical protein JSW39_08505 [Desulfobacterales bacterium]|nr:MAG: hypothetical protein JSW39_08505 [Desulfobacterales bacterium]